MDSEQLDAVYGALSDATRRAMLARLAKGEASVNELAAPFDISQPAISRHIKVLEQAGLVTRSRAAQKRPVKISLAPLEGAVDHLEGLRQAYAASFARLDALLEHLKSVPGDSGAATSPRKDNT
ncbi:MAG: winged helix-turn-helix transcriptional regulator [Hyphomicrobiaceae bacterium]|nr:winged helix-turn-helix transcriptional regulator [Hyphomicrobiaceae bacterium]MCC0023840.1 winged helix-turn-helix transcriptional regulator [Hyphomicrobiaceae bacterium]